MKQKVALVLSSGGARGIAHIGVIEELERLGFEITSIAGASMGALVGGMYASGHFEAFKKRLAEINKVSILELIDFGLNPGGIIKGERLINEFKKIFGDTCIEDCRIPFCAIATDIKNSEEIVFESGSLYEAIRASISIPSFFKPYRWHGKLLVDGGVINPLPLNRVKRTEGDILISVNVLANDEKVKKNSFKKSYNERFNFSHGDNMLQSSIMSQTMKIMMKKLNVLTEEVYKPDIIINFPMSSCEVYEFYNSKKITKIGALKTREIVSEYLIEKSNNPNKVHLII